MTKTNFKAPLLNILIKLNPYHWIRPVLFRMDAEKAHHLAIACLKKGFGPHFANRADKRLNTNVCGLSFPNPVGLAAGFDKQAEIISEAFGFGFGSVELGSITPRPQPGNPQPRLFRIPESEAIINRYGFNSDGFDVCLRRVIAYRDSRMGQGPQGVLGINIGKNKESADAAADYVAGVKTFASFADYLTVNISSPNTPGLRDLQAKEIMADLLKQVMETRSAQPKQPPIFLKIAPDQTEEQMNDIAEVVLDSGVNGIIIGNTTVNRPKSIVSAVIKETGGLSGKPLFSLSTQILSKLYQLTGGKIPLIGAGGVSNGEDAYAKIRAGASLVQVYSALIYEGPLLITQINRELSSLLERDGFASVADAVGKGMS